MGEPTIRVLHVIDALGVGGGAEHSLAVMLPMLRERGVQSDVAVLKPRVQGLEHALREDGFDIELLAGSSLAGQIRSLRAKVRRERYDVVHCSLYYASLAARLAVLGTDVPLVNSFVNTSYDAHRLRSLGLDRRKVALVRFVDRVTSRRVSRAHAITQATGDEAASVLGIPRDRITVIPRGRSGADLGERSDERRRSVRKRLGLAFDAPMILNVGRQDGQKAQDDLVRAFSKVALTRPDAHLFIAGRAGDASAELESAISDSSAADRVHVLGHRGDVPDLLAACDVFAFPSRYEGLGCALVEAMALEAPIVGSDAAAIAEVLDYGRVGAVVERGDVDSLAATLIDVLGSAERRAEMSERGAVEFHQRYQLDLVVDAMADLYRAVEHRSGSWRRS